MSGIPAGCPIVVAARGVIAWPWQASAQRAGATAARRYVDDFTAWARGEAEDCRVATGQRRQYFATAAQLTISQAKSGAFANSPLVRAGIEEDGPSVPILTSFKDLGILQHAGKVSAAATAARAQRTFGRLERLAGLPLPLHRRVQAVAAAGVAAAAYGAIAGTPPLHRRVQAVAAAGVAAAAYGAIAGTPPLHRRRRGSGVWGHRRGHRRRPVPQRVEDFEGLDELGGASAPTRGPPLAPRQHREHLVAQRM